MVSTVFRFALIGIIIAIVIGVVGVVSFSWRLETSVYLQGLTSFLHVIYYILPIQKLSSIIVCIVSLMVFRTVIAIVKTIWELIPIRG